MSNIIIIVHWRTDESNMKLHILCVPEITLKLYLVSGDCEKTNFVYVSETRTVVFLRQRANSS